MGALPAAAMAALRSWPTRRTCVSSALP